MSYKIVQTIEKGKLNLTIIPNSWEKDGLLLWPKNKIDKLIQNKFSVPEKDWLQMPCILKRSNLKTYREAENEVEKMCEDDDTEGLYSDKDGPSKKRYRSTNKTLYSPIPDFNNLMPQILEPCTSDEGTKNEKITVQSEERDINKLTRNVNLSSSIVTVEDDKVVQYTEPQSDILYQGQETQSSSYVILGEASANGFIRINEENISMSQVQLDQSTEQKIDNIIANQTVMMERLAKLETMFDELIKQMIKQSDTSLYINKKTTQNTDLLLPNPIDTVEELKVFEDKLKDKNKLQKFVHDMSFICGDSGKGNGIDHCYMLIDKFFTRRFMTLCSWAGGSREKKKNIAFKFYKNSINAFFQIIRLADNDFSLESCHMFLKNVIRNKTRRNESVLLRTSKSKKRPKKLLYKNIKKTEVLSTEKTPKQIERDMQNDENIEGDDEGSDG